MHVCPPIFIEKKAAVKRRGEAAVFVLSLTTFTSAFFRQAENHLLRTSFLVLFQISIPTTGSKRPSHEVARQRPATLCADCGHSGTTAVPGTLSSGAPVPPDLASLQTLGDLDRTFQLCVPAFA